MNGVGCDTAVRCRYSPNDCIMYPDLQTQSGDKLIGIACSLCIVEVFWADNTPSDNDGHGEGSGVHHQWRSGRGRRLQHRAAV